MHGSTLPEAHAGNTNTSVVAICWPVRNLSAHLITSPLPSLRPPHSLCIHSSIRAAEAAYLPVFESQPAGHSEQICYLDLLREASQIKETQWKLFRGADDSFSVCLTKEPKKEYEISCSLFFCPSTNKCLNFNFMTYELPITSHLLKIPTDYSSKSKDLL